MTKSTDILISTHILSGKNKTYDTFTKYISSDFRTIKASNPHEYIEFCWNSYETKCP